MSDVLFSNRLEQKELELGHNEYQEYLKQRISDYFSEYTLDDYKEFFDLCQDIIAHSEDKKSYQFQMRVEQVFLSLEARDKELYVKVFEYHLNLDDPLCLLYIYRPLRALIDIQGVEHTKSMIDRVSVAVRSRWLFGFYSCLSSSEITPEHLTQLLDLYTSATLENLPRDMEFLNNYREVNKSVFPKVVNLLLEKVEEEPRYAYSFERMFNPYSSLYDELPEIFVGDIGLLKRAYLAVVKIEPHLDHDAKTLSYILDKDKNFIVDFVDIIFPEAEFYSKYGGHINFSFVWRRADHLELMKIVTRFIQERESKPYGLINSCLEAFFVLRSEEKDNDLLRERQDAFLLELIEKGFADSDLIDLVFDIISEFAPERRIKFIKRFLVDNKDFDRFRLLQVEPSHWSWSGSQVPVLQSRASYLESLLSLLNTVDLLEHKQHIEQRIRSLRDSIEAEKKRDFLERF